jgi:hypothetical protein
MKIEESIREALKSIEKFDFHLEKTDTNITRIAIKPIQRKKQKVNVLSHQYIYSLHISKDKNVPDYTPRAVDFNSVTMNQEMQVENQSRFPWNEY